MNGKKDFISITDLSPKEISAVFEDAARYKKNPNATQTTLRGKSIALIFQKPSTRTFVSFSVGIYQLGGLPLLLHQEDLQWRRGETIADTARALSCYVDGLVVRAIRHVDVEEFARRTTFPVVNGLTDEEHPCQVLSDVFTIMDHTRKTLKEIADLKIVFLGDGNNVAQSWLLAAGMLGLKFTLVCPKNYSPNEWIVDRAQRLAASSGAKIEVRHDTLPAIKGADVLYTDVWTSMGQEKERTRRLKVFRPFQLNQRIVRLTGKQPIIMHCLPAHRGEEVTEEVLDGPLSIVYKQARTRLFVQKAILAHIFHSRKK